MSTALACPPGIRLVPTNAIDTNVVEALCDIAISATHHTWMDCEIINALYAINFNLDQINSVWSDLKNAHQTHRADAFGVLTGGVA